MKNNIWVLYLLIMRLITPILNDTQENSGANRDRNLELNTEP